MHALPAALAPFAAFNQFIIYTVVPHATKPGKTNKFPCDFRTGRVASAHESSIWTDSSNAIAAAAEYNRVHPAGAYGVGFVFTLADPFWFLDIDGAYDGAKWSELAVALCQAFAGCAIEVSNSGKGLHIFGTGPVPQHKTKNSDLGLEFYNSGRFVALTGINAVGNAGHDASALLPSLVAQFFPPDGFAGAALSGTLAEQWQAACAAGPSPEWRGTTDDDKLIERMLRSTSASSAFGGGIQFADLWNCDPEALARVYPDTSATNSLPYDASSADSALAQRLAFWTGKDCARIERLMRRSALARDKWEREDYLPRTILAVCARQYDVLTDKLPEPVAGMPSLAGAYDGAAPAYSAPVVDGAPAVERRAAPRGETVTGDTFLDPVKQMDLFAGCVYVCDMHRILVPGGALLKEGQFKVRYGGYTFCMDFKNERMVRDSWEAFTQSQAFRSPRADAACFKPQEPPGALLVDAGLTRVNTYWPVEVPRKVGDATRFYTHLAKLLPNERDRYILLCYMAACVQHQGYKFQWAPFVQGVEGNGKTLLSRCVAEAVGRRYVHWPKASKLAKEFNAWMVGKVFYAVEDIYVADNRRDVMEELKPMITGGDGLEIEGKGVDQVSADICGNFMFNSNHRDMVTKHRNDRRCGIFYTAQQQASDLVRDGMDGNYMSEIYNWLRAEGYAIVAELLHTFPIPDEYNPAKLLQRAPETSSTEEAIIATRGGVEQEVQEAIEQGLPGFCGGWLSSLALERLLERLGRARMMTHAKRHEMLEKMGYARHTGLTEGRVNNTTAPDMGKPILFVKIGSPAAATSGTPAAIASAYAKAQEVGTTVGA